MTSVVIIVVLGANILSFAGHTVLGHQILQLIGNLVRETLFGLTAIHNDKVQSGLCGIVLAKVFPLVCTTDIIVTNKAVRLQASSPNSSGQASIILQTHQMTSILGNGAIGIKDESSHNLIRSNLQSMIIKLVSNLVQKSLQVRISGDGQGILLSGVQLIVDVHSERVINRDNDVIILVVIVVVAGGIASGQHADGHDAGQSQRSNLLEFHNDFFLLMVYKR